ncbi:MAG: MFS transporter [Actinomycetota bacterium]|jgi:MFS family permease|nr:MFS transporter [Actinomycetota bacterium]
MSDEPAPREVREGPAVTSRTFEAFSVPAYRVLWWSGLFSFLGVQMQMLVRGLLAWDLTERESGLGVVFLVFGVSMLVSTPFGGVAADRFRKRWLLFIGQFVITVAAVGMGAAVIAGVEQFWMLLVVSAAQGSMFGLIGPARTSFTTELVGRDLLGNAITLSILSMSFTRVFAPSFAGILAGYEAVGIGGAYLVAAFFSLVSAVLTFRLPDTGTGEPSGTGPLREIADGVRYVVARPPLRRVVVTSTVVIMFGFNYLAFMPALVEGEFGLGDAQVGYMSTASSIGAVAVSMLIASRAGSPRARGMIVGFGAAFGVTVMLFGLTPSYGWALFVVAFIGAATTGFQSLTGAVALSDTDSSHQGRVQSLMQLSFAGFGIAALPLGVLAEMIGLREAIVVMGAVTAGAVLLFAIGERRDIPLPRDAQPGSVAPRNGHTP